MDKIQAFVVIIAILLIASLEILAIVKGIDGRTLGIALAAIALLAPSPVYVIKWGKVIEIIKGKTKANGSDD